MSEWFKEPVLKTGDSSRAVGSNPTANFFYCFRQQKDAAEAASFCL